MNPLKQAQQLYRVRASWLGEGGQPSPNAQLRANQCLGCPHNQPKGFEELFKGVVASMVKKQITLKEQLQATVDGEDRLHVCSLCGCYLPLKVHVPLHIARENTPDWGSYPGYCWLRMDQLT